MWTIGGFACCSPKRNSASRRFLSCRNSTTPPTGNERRAGGSARRSVTKLELVSSSDRCRLLPLRENAGIWSGVFSEAAALALAAMPRTARKTSIAETEEAEATTIAEDLLPVPMQLFAASHLEPVAMQPSPVAHLEPALVPRESMRPRPGEMLDKLPADRMPSTPQDGTSGDPSTPLGKTLA
jgi:hypothetical protein